jgi:hypothetical protein
MKTTNTNQYTSKSVNVAKMMHDFNVLPLFKGRGDLAIKFCDDLLMRSLKSKRANDKKLYCLAFGVAVSYFEETKTFDRYDAKIYNEEYLALCKSTNCETEIIRERKDITNLFLHEEKLLVPA